MANNALANEIKRCPKCNGVLAIIGRVHLCRPTLRSEVHVYDAPAQLKAEGVDMRVGKTKVVGRSSAGSEQRTSNSPVAGSSPVVPAKDLTEAALEQALVEVGIPATPLAIKPKRAVFKRDPLSAQGAGPAPAKKTASTYDHRDPKQRREYQRELMRKRRAALPKVKSASR